MQDYRIFLSSFSREFVEDQVGENKDDPLWNLRWQIYEEGGGSVYVADHDERDSGSLALLAKHDPLAATDVLIERSMQSSEMVVILGGNRRGRDEHGKLIEVNKRISQVSHFEIELFHAAFTRKPVYFFILEGFDPGPRLAALLKLIEPAFPHLNLEIRNSPEKILSEIRRIREGPVSTIAAANGDLFQSLLYASRNEGGANPVLFLDGAVEVRSDGPDETLVQELLKESSSLPEMHRKLSRQWIAAREMMAVDYRSSAITVDHLKLWNSVLSSWSGSAAWSGLFAPVFGGVFAAINSIDIVRKKLALSSRSDIPEEARLRPFGAYASAYYSRAKKSPFHDHKFYLKRALEYCNKEIEINGGGKPGIFAVRGSIQAHRGRFHWSFFDFRKALILTEKMAVSDTAVGEALLNYGYMKAKGSRGYWGRGDMNRGLSLIKDNPIARLRGLRKMADVSRKPEAMKCLEEARALASKDGVMDQLLQIDAAIKALMGK